MLITDFNVEIGDVWEICFPFGTKRKFLVLDLIEDRRGPIAFIQVLNGYEGFYASRDTFERFDKPASSYELLARA